MEPVPLTVPRDQRETEPEQPVAQAQASEREHGPRLPDRYRAKQGRERHLGGQQLRRHLPPAFECLAWRRQLRSRHALKQLARLTGGHDRGDQRHNQRFGNLARSGHKRAAERLGPSGKTGASAQKVRTHDRPHTPATHGRKRTWRPLLPYTSQTVGPQRQPQRAAERCHR